MITIFFVAALALSACKSSKNTTSTSNVTETWIIANKTVNCDNNTEAQCLQIKKGSSPFYQVLNEEIKGFNYEPGFKYQVEVKKTTNKKTGTSYVLVKELFKIPMK